MGGLLVIVRCVLVKWVYIGKTGDIMRYLWVSSGIYGDILGDIWG